MGPKHRKGLTQKQQDIFAVHGFNQALIDQVTRKKDKNFRWTADDIRKFVEKHNRNNPSDKKGITGQKMPRVGFPKKALKKKKTPARSRKPRRKETTSVLSRNSCLERNQKVSEVHGITHQKTAISTSGEGDRAGFQNRAEIPVIGYYGTPRSQRVLSGRTFRGHKPLCHSCQASHHHAKRHPAGQKNPGREAVDRPTQKPKFSVLFRTTKSSKRSFLRKALK